MVTAIFPEQEPLRLLWLGGKEAAAVLCPRGRYG